MRHQPRILCLSAALACSFYAHAEQPVSLTFEHKDWEVVCDNTRTCRAAGYSVDGVDMPVSVLLTRKAGANERVTAQLRLGDYDDPPNVSSLDMSIGSKKLGAIKYDAGNNIATLSDAQTDALLASLKDTADIQWSSGNRSWQLSDAGATAVLLKMDEFQGRVDTASALIRRGNKPASSTSAPVAAPVVTAVKPTMGISPVASKLTLQALRADIVATIKGSEDCPMLTDNDLQQRDVQFEVKPLSKDKSLVIASCWYAAYNDGNGYWVINHKTPHAPILITTMANDYEDGVISSFQKGRGLGDCNSKSTWHWNGATFVLTSELTTGMCRLISPGGTWELPTYVADVEAAIK